MHDAVRRFGGFAGFHNADETAARHVVGAAAKQRRPEALDRPTNPPNPNTPPPLPPRPSLSLPLPSPVTGRVAEQSRSSVFIVRRRTSPRPMARAPPNVCCSASPLASSRDNGRISTCASGESTRRWTCAVTSPAGRPASWRRIIANNDCAIARAAAEDAVRILPLITDVTAGRIDRCQTFAVANRSRDGRRSDRIFAAADRCPTCSAADLIGGATAPTVRSRGCCGSAPCCRCSSPSRRESEDRCDLPSARRSWSRRCAGSR